MTRWLYDHTLSHHNGRGRIWHLRMFVERGLFGFCREDVWSVDCFLAKVLPPMLRELQDSRFTDDCTQEMWNERWERWAAAWETLGDVFAEPDYDALHESLDLVKAWWC